MLTRGAYPNGTTARAVTFLDLIHGQANGTYGAFVGPSVNSRGPFDVSDGYNSSGDTELEVLIQATESAMRVIDFDPNCTDCGTNWTTNWTANFDDLDGHVDTDQDTSRAFVLLFNFWMLGVIMPLIAIFGIFANVASIVVLTRPYMRSSTINVYLAGLSAFDGLLLLMSFLLYPPLSFCEMNHSDPNSPWCRYFFYSALFTYPLSLIMQSCSVFTLCAITVDRFIAISWPLRSRDWCTSRRAYLTLSAIVAWSILYNLPAFFELRLKTIPSPEPTPDLDTAETVGIALLNITPTDDVPLSVADTSVVVLDQTELRRQTVYKVAYKGYCYLFFMLLIPAGAMIVLNLIVTVRVRRAYRWRRSMSGREEKERRCTIMAVLVVVTFLVFNSLAFANNMIEIFASEEGTMATTKRVPYLLSVSIGNVLVALNSASNFVIYVALGVRFRNVFCKLFCLQKCQPVDTLASRYISSRSRLGELSYKPVHVRSIQHGRDRDNTTTRHSNSAQNGSGSGRLHPSNGTTVISPLCADREMEDIHARTNGHFSPHRSFGSSCRSVTSAVSQ